MIRNKLAEILAQKNIKQVDIYKGTGISKTTLSAIATNATDMIKLSSLDNICQYLNITPGDFFDFLPYTLEYKESFIDKTDEQLTFSLDVFFKQNERIKYQIFLTCMTTADDTTMYIDMWSDHPTEGDKPEISIGLQSMIEAEIFEKALHFSWSYFTARDNVISNTDFLHLL